MTAALWDALPKPIALVCGSGTHNAAAQVGMLDIMCAEGWRPDLTIGCSGGALVVAALVADPQDPASLAERMWLDAAVSKGARFGWPQLAARLAGREWSRVTPDWKSVFAPHLKGVSFEPGSTKVMVATDVGAGQAIELQSGPVLDALLASAAFPGVFPPVERDGVTLVDGSFAAPMPVQQALGHGAASIVCLDTGRSAIDARLDNPGRWYDVVVTAVHHQVAAKASHDLFAAAHEAPIVVISTPQPHAVGWDDVAARMHQGRHDATEQLAQVTARWQEFTHPGVYAVARDVREDRRLTGVIRE